MSTLKVPPVKSDHFIGQLGSPVVLIEYGDFQCPHCAAAAPSLEQIVEEFNSSICYIYRHFPLREIHPMAEFAALASEAADQQGEFWGMHHLLFENQIELSPENILRFAHHLKLDLDEFKKDLKRPDLLERINEDFMGGIRSGVNGTPTLFMNVYRFDFPPRYEFLKPAIQQVLANGGHEMIL